jgi:hypothetical protein
MLMLMGVTLDMCQWSLAQIELQRSADIAATAGALRYAAGGAGVASGCTAATDQLACTAVNAAADLAEVNKVPGATTRSWNDGTKTLTDNLAVASVVAGVRNANDAAISVTLSRPVPAAFAFPVHGQSSYTITATSVAELIPNPSSGGPQPCIAALDGYGSGVTTEVDLSISGNANLTLNGCSLRSNESITLNGNVNVVTSGIYAGNSIYASKNANITGPQFPESGQIADPYAGDAVLQSTFSQLTTQTTQSFSGGGSPLPGKVYSSMSITANTTLAAGLYVVTGSFSVSGNSAVTGTGVTIVVGGSVSISGNSNFNVTAPADASNGGVPGILIAGNGTQGGSISGNASSAISGVIYFPNSTISFSGNGATNGQANCLEVIASSVTISGNANMGGNCASLGVKSFGSTSSPPTVRLVQ